MQKNIYILTIILSLFSILLVVFLLFPLFSEIKRLSQELVILKAKIENLKNFKKVYLAISPELEKIDNLFADFELPINFIEFMEKTAKESNLIVKISLLPKPKEEEKKEDWLILTFQIRTTAPFPRFLSFFEKIENSPYLIKIQDLTITRVPKDPELEGEKEKFEINAIITLKVFAR
jgi:Tfp pilus assembly protein PilO